MTSEQDIKKIREMLEFLVRHKISENVEKLSEDEKIVYKLIGKNVKEISARTNFSVGKISGIWRELENKGLLIKEGRNYRKVV